VSKGPVFGLPAWSGTLGNPQLFEPKTHSTETQIQKPPCFPGLSCRYVSVGSRAVVGDSSKDKSTLSGYAHGSYIQVKTGCAKRPHRSGWFALSLKRSLSPGPLVWQGLGSGHLRRSRACCLLRARPATRSFQ
jgi:hypothetical protein